MPLPVDKEDNYGSDNTDYSYEEDGDEYDILVDYEVDDYGDEEYSNEGHDYNEDNYPNESHDYSEDNYPEAPTLPVENDYPDYPEVPALPVDDYENLQFRNSEPEAAVDEVQEESKSCPGGDLETCIDVCPGFNKVAFGLCVGECGQRCL